MVDISACGSCRLWNRRDVLGTLAALGALSCVGTPIQSDDTAPLNTESTCAPDFDPSSSDWHEFSFSKYPELTEPDGWVTIKESSLLLDIIVASLPDGCLVALWRICSHGACPLSWYPKQEQARCGCHGSRFNTDGDVLNGPATEPIRTFPIARTDRSFWIYRPL